LGNKKRSYGNLNFIYVVIHPLITFRPLAEHSDHHLEMYFSTN